MEKNDGQAIKTTLIVKKLDWYILKRYLLSFLVMLILFIPIGIISNLSEKIDDLTENKVPLEETLYFYVNFIIHFANLLFPILLFLSAPLVFVAFIILLHCFFTGKYADRK